ncbi:MAG TPA: MATE family efflux transporter, partial [Anaerolineae bacterium]|nr:MATE family efflux transporter [Anaerolineae bacterium]
MPSFVTAAYIGRHWGALFQDAYTLANLTGNLCCMSLLAGLHSAADTLGPQALGAGNHRNVGLVACQTLVTSFIIIVPVNVLLCCTLGPLLVALGQDGQASALAWEFYIIYCWSIPFYAVWCVAWKFLSAQAVLWPLVVVTLGAVGFVLPLALQVLGAAYGLPGTAAALVVFFASQAVAIGAWMYFGRPYQPSTIDHYTWTEILCQPSYQQFLKLGVGGMLASLEWIYWEAVSLMVGRLGVIPLSVHTVPTQVIYVAFMFPLGMGAAASNRIGTTLCQSVPRAKVLAVATLVVSVVIFTLFTGLLYATRAFLFRLFTNDPDVWEGCETIWPSVCVYTWVLVLFGVNTGIATGLGMQMTLGVLTLAFLWCVGLPASYYFALVQGQGLPAVWIWITPPYFLINALLWLRFYTKDWEELATLVRIR